MTIKLEPTQVRAYFVCGTQDVPGQDLNVVVQMALDAGITAFQYRDKGNSQLTTAERFALGQQLRERCAQAHVPFIVDDDVELALALQADGVHVGQKDDRVSQVIQRVANQMFVGLSCSTLAEVQTANQLEGIAYLGSGPIFPTTSKVDADPVVGLAGLQQLVVAAKCPVVAIGGITVAQLPAIAATGAAGAAVISMLTRSPDMAATVKAMLTATEVH